MTRGRAFDLAVVGAGVFGLSIARRAAAAGLRTCLIDRARPGAGASGGPLGALMPHMPDRWNDKKQFQFDALAALPATIAELEAETGRATGYRRTGRVMPIRSEAFEQRVAERRDGSRTFWDTPRTGFQLDRGQGRHAGWIDPAAAPGGVVFDNLSARIDPRAYLAALAASVRRSCAVRTGFDVRSVDAAGGRILGAGADPIVADRIVLAAGHAGFGLLRALTGAVLGIGVKGQAALLDTRADPDQPVIYDDGTYLVVHEDGRTAVGSTSRTDWDDEHGTDPADCGFLAHARLMVPALHQAPVLEWWAGVRPKCLARDPLVGAVPGLDRVIVATGGFKISFGIAHKVADAVVAIAGGEPAAAVLPRSFTPEHHFGRAGVRRAEPETRHAVTPPRAPPRR